MYQINTPDGPKFMVQLVGPASYRMGNQITFRGGTLTVSKRTRDYLVRKTNGAWADFDPAPPEPIEEVLPPQFGEIGGPAIDLDDIDPQKNPPLSIEHAMLLAARGSEVDQEGRRAAQGGEGLGIDPDDLAQSPGAPAPSDAGSGDMTAADLKGAIAPGPGGASAKAPNVKIATAVPAKPKEAPKGAVTVD